MVGWIEGSDPARRNEHVVLTAHFDHLAPDSWGHRVDSVFNGADDNA